MQNQLKFYRKNTSVIILDVCDYQFNSGDTLYFTVKIKPDNDQDDSSALIKTSWTVGTDVDVTEDNKLELTLSATQTDIDFGDYFYDIKLVSVQEPEAESTLVTGNISVMDVATLRV